MFVDFKPEVIKLLLLTITIIILIIRIIIIIIIVQFCNTFPKVKVTSQSHSIKHSPKMKHSDNTGVKQKENKGEKKTNYEVQKEEAMWSNIQTEQTVVMFCMLGSNSLLWSSLDIKVYSDTKLMVLAIVQHLILVLFLAYCIKIMLIIYYKHLQC